jgi:hypothetical protein
MLNVCTCTYIIHYLIAYIEIKNLNNKIVGGAYLYIVRTVGSPIFRRSFTRALEIRKPGDVETCHFLIRSDGEQEILAASEPHDSITPPSGFQVLYI